MTALLMTSKDADRPLLQNLCIAPVRLFDESVMESAVACWEWLLAARSDLRAQVLSEKMQIIARLMCRSEATHSLVCRDLMCIQKLIQAGLVLTHDNKL